MSVSDLLLNILTRSDKRALKETADEFDKLGRKADDAGGKLGGVAKESGHVDEQLEKTKVKLRELGEEFDRTGKKELLPQIRRERGSLAALEKIKRDLASPELIGGGIIENLDRAFSAGLAKAGQTISSHPYVAAGIAAAIAAGAPAIGAAVSAAVLLGVGGGALAAGIVAAAQDQRVSSAYKDLGANVVRDFETASAPLVEPLVKGASKLGGAFDKMLPAIQSGMAKLAPVVDHLVDGVVGFIDKIGPGFGHAFDAALPLLNQLAADLPLLGQGIGNFLDAIAAGGPGAVAFFHDLIVLISLTLTYVGGLVLALSTVYNVLSALSRVMSGDLAGAVQIWEQFGDKGKDGAKGTQELADSLKKAGDEAARTSDLADQVGFAAQTAGLGARIAKVDFGTLSSAIADTGSTADQLAGKMTDRLMGTMLGMSHANLGVAESLNSLKDTLSTTGLAIDKHTGQVSMSSKAGLALRESVLGGVEANLRMYDAQIASGVGADVATAKYEANTKALHDQLRAAGLTEAQVSDLIGEYGKVPGKVNTAIATQGLTEAINNLNTLLRQLLGLPSYKRVTIDQVTIARRIDAGNSVGAGVRLNRWGGIWQHAAVGTLRDAQVYSSVSSGARYAFAEPETGGEAFIPKFGDRGRSLGILSQAASWYGATVVPGGGGSSGASGGSVGRGGGGTVTEWHTAAPGDQVAEVLLSLLRPTVRGRYGGDVSVAMGGAA